MMPVIQIGPLALPAPGLLLMLGIWLGLSFAERFAPRRGISGDRLFNLALTGLLTGLIGARLAYVLRYSAAFSANPMDIFSRNPGLLDLWSGVWIGLLGSAIYLQRKKLPAWQTLDALTPALAVFAIALSLSHLASGDAYGAPADLPWSIELWGEHRHPSQIYAILAAIAILIALWPSRPWLLALRPGAYFLIFMGVFAVAQLFLEIFRGDSQVITSGLRTSQLIAWMVLAVCLVLLGRRLDFNKP
jgi:phosphatidylglycerol:prolipoprotein diacylglycerol transferase